MTGKYIEQVLRDEAEYTEAHKDAPLRDGTIFTHKNQRTYVLSIRLSESERAGLEQGARQAGVPASSLARQWIAEKLVSQSSPTDVHDVADVLETMANRLRKTRNTGGGEANAT